ncbi:hypothetical protein EVAR_69830_1 [Eumeta japonica]|uniref:Circadian clock-controlled protein n=1 Tax=Eumeta variegata TaxID=151549 RepID=A0A4C1ZUZ0_EUMVA|nr:hypothetical protein EVAR_69830_1 [Eumeta japonica]
MGKTLVIILVFAVCVSEVLSKNVTDRTTSEDEEDEFTKDIPICHYSDPNVTECIQRAAEHARIFLAHGIPSMGIQPLEPLRVPSVRLRQHNAPDNAFKYDAWLSDVTVMGLTDYTFNKLDVYPEELKVTANLSLPHLYLRGEYVVLGHFQMLPVEAVGKMYANFTSCSAAIEATGARVHRRMVVRDAVVRLRCVGAPHVQFADYHSATEQMAQRHKYTPIIFLFKIEGVGSLSPPRWLSASRGLLTTVVISAMIKSRTDSLTEPHTSQFEGNELNH